MKLSLGLARALVVHHVKLNLAFEIIAHRLDLLDGIFFLESAIRTPLERGVGESIHYFALPAQIIERNRTALGYA